MKGLEGAFTARLASFRKPQVKIIFTPAGLIINQVLQ